MATSFLPLATASAIFARSCLTASSDEFASATRPKGGGALLLDTGQCRAIRRLRGFACCRSNLLLTSSIILPSRRAFAGHRQPRYAGRMRYGLRTLLIVLALGPPVLAALLWLAYTPRALAVLGPIIAVLVLACAVAAVRIATLLKNR